MPWYRIPFNMRERGRAAALEASPRTKVQEALLELVKCATPLEDVFGAGGMAHFNFGRDNKTAPAPCCACGWMSSRLCDFRISGGRDCDAPLCTWCTWSPLPEKDICPAHVGAVKAWLAGRTNSVDGVG